MVAESLLLMTANVSNVLHCPLWNKFTIHSKFTGFLCIVLFADALPVKKHACAGKFYVDTFVVC